MMLSIQNNLHYKSNKSRFFVTYTINPHRSTYRHSLLEVLVFLLLGNISNILTLSDF